MKQADLNRAVARVTGESVRLVRQRGFTFVNVVTAERHPETSCTAHVLPHANARCLPAAQQPSTAA